MKLYIRYLLIIFRHLFLSVCLTFFAAHVVVASPDGLRETYKEIESVLLENKYDTPIYLESEKFKNIMRGKVYGIIYQPYKTVSKNITSQINWCEIMPQHLNIKACTYQYINKQCRLTFYTGRKFYEKADKVYHLDYQFKVTTLKDDYFNVTLNSEKGPLDTTDYIINVEAIPLTDDSTFIHLSYEYKFGIWTRIAMSTYFTTIGRKKIGFTISGEDENQKPIYIKGIRGVIERNSMRYYFAIKSYLNTKNIPIETRFIKKITSWFALTEKHHTQLYEMDIKEYLKYKKMERLDQIRLQKEINKSRTTPDMATSCIINNDVQQQLKDSAPFNWSEAEQPE